MDVASLMALTAEKNTVDQWTAELLKRASRLLRETTECCHAIAHDLEHERRAAGEEQLLKAIFEGGINDDTNDETD